MSTQRGSERERERERGAGRGEETHSSLPVGVRRVCFSSVRVRSSLSIPFSIERRESTPWRLYESVDRLSDGRSSERLLQIIGAGLAGLHKDKLDTDERQEASGDRQERVGNLALRLINEWRQRSSLLFVLRYAAAVASHLNVVLFRVLTQLRGRVTYSSHATFYGLLSHTHTYARTHAQYERRHTRPNTHSWMDLVAASIAVNLSCCRATRCVHGTFLEEIGHDGAGHGYLGTSTINVGNFSTACSFCLATCWSLWFNERVSRYLAN